MIPFELAEPSSLKEALSLLDADDATVRPIAGGTALMLMMKAGMFRPTRLVALRRVEREFSRIEIGPDGSLNAGAGATLGSLERTKALRESFPVIARTLRTLSNVRVRNVATIGGNLAHADPHMDLPPVLAALGAQVTIAGPAGERTVAVEHLFAGYYETVLARNELIARLSVPPQGGRRSAYLKVTTRSADDWPALGVAASIDAQGRTIRGVDLFVSAATEKPIRLKAAEAVLRGRDADEAALRRAGEAAAGEVEVIADARGSASYKKELVRVYVARAVRSALGLGDAQGRAA
jgi:aerobic carbon-monoxide dehydrogenase medium subunit